MCRFGIKESSFSIWYKEHNRRGWYPFFGKDKAEHWWRLRKVPKKSVAGITLRKDKIEFGKSSIRVVAHVVNEGTISVDLAKVEIIPNLDLPTVMGMVNYLGKFSKNSASLAKPIYTVMGKKAEWLWGEPQQEALRAYQKGAY